MKRGSSIPAQTRETVTLSNIQRAVDRRYGVFKQRGGVCAEGPACHYRKAPVRNSERRRQRMGRIHKMRFIGC